MHPSIFLTAWLQECWSIHSYPVFLSQLLRWIWNEIPICTYCTIKLWRVSWAESVYESWYQHRLSLNGCSRQNIQRGNVPFSIHLHYTSNTIKVCRLLCVPVGLVTYKSGQEKRNGYSVLDRHLLESVENTILGRNAVFTSAVGKYCIIRVMWPFKFPLIV